MTAAFRSLNLFADPIHETFHLPAGAPSALLIHGYLGTPAEMRPLADALHAAGWTVHGLCLPGFGADIHTLADRRWPEWVDAALAAQRALAVGGGPVLLIGFSLGGAVAVLTAAKLAAEAQPAAGLVLLAPLSHLLPGWQRFIWTILKRVVRRFRPFRKADFNDPRLRRGVGELLPALDLDEAAVQAVLRDLTIPAAVPDQLGQIGRAVRRAAPALQLPTLVLQGARDVTVRPKYTRRLVAKMPAHVGFVEIDGAHDLVQPDLPAWPTVRAAVLTFAESLRF